VAADVRLEASSKGSDLYFILLALDPTTRVRSNAPPSSLALFMGVDRLRFVVTAGQQGRPERHDHPPPLAPGHEPIIIGGLRTVTYLQSGMSSNASGSVPKSSVLGSRGLGSWFDRVRPSTAPTSSDPMMAR
jgi:hypothetical protein